MIMRGASVLSAVMLAGCVAQGPSLNLQAEQMELALLECKAQLGLPGLLKTNVTFDGGVASAQAVAFDQLSAADAARINSCASGAATLSGGLLVVPMSTSVPVDVAAPMNAVVVADQPQTVRQTGCPVGYSGMYGGTLYCTGGGN